MHRQTWRLLVFFLGGVVLASSLSFPLGAALAQSRSPKTVAEEVYQQLPNLPQENGYTRSATNQTATDSTLVSRLIQYHTAVKGRSPLYRLDWKITLADYLGINDYLDAEVYPGKSFLTENPMQPDIAAVQKLSRSERNALIQALVNRFGGGEGAAQAVSTSQTAPKAADRPPLAPTPFPARGSAADLLLPTPSRDSSNPEGDAQFLLP